MLSRDKRLPLDTWNTSGLQQDFFGNQISKFDSFRNHLPPTPQAFAHRTFCSLKPHSIPVMTILQDLKHLTKREIPSFPSASHPMCHHIFVVVGACPPQRLSV